MQTLACNDVQDGIPEVRLNRPESLDAINPTLIGELTGVFQGPRHDRRIRVVILAGDGKGICAGAAAGGRLAIALACDMRIALEDARFGAAHAHQQQCAIR
jgi:enoyl-CoA hydratase/carnithine racemase